MIPEVEIIIRLLVAAALGAAVGFERERHNQPAGLRTHIVLVVGAALAMALSVDIAERYAPDLRGDPARLAAQVITGVGFLGAGAILRSGANIRGLTTAASLWTMAVVGLAIGSGMYWAGVATTVLLWIILYVVDLIEKKVFGPDMVLNLSLQLQDRPGIMEEVRHVWEKNKIEARITGLTKNMQENILHVEFRVRTRKGALLELLTEEFGQFAGVKSYRIGL